MPVSGGLGTRDCCVKTSSIDNNQLYYSFQQSSLPINNGPLETAYLLSRLEVSDKCTATITNDFDPQNGDESPSFLPQDLSNLKMFKCPDLVVVNINDSVFIFTATTTRNPGIEVNLISTFYRRRERDIRSNFFGSIGFIPNIRRGTSSLELLGMEYDVRDFDVDLWQAVFKAFPSITRLVIGPRVLSLDDPQASERPFFALEPFGESVLCPKLRFMNMYPSECRATWEIIMKNCLRLRAVKGCKMERLSFFSQRWEGGEVQWSDMEGICGEFQILK